MRLYNNLFIETSTCNLFITGLHNLGFIGTKTRIWFSVSLVCRSEVMYTYLEFVLQGGPKSWPLPNYQIYENHTKACQ